MIMAKIILSFFMALYSIGKIVDGISNKYENTEDKIVNLIEIVSSALFTLLIINFGN